ncbi:hypothetical protein ACWDTT_33285 [Streptosporangium sandarakinum]
MTTTTAAQPTTTTTTRTIVWRAKLVRSSFGQNSVYEDDVPYRASEDEAVAWVEDQIARLLDDDPDRSVRWHLTGHVDAGWPDVVNGRPAFWPMEELYGRVYALLGEMWCWRSVGRHPDER